ncbi:hypothetical protein LCGC14_1557930 [marine sediment metagenome]|uniref:NadR/Ttd14 AAA domain-containing protein n=1 Tax=marine sediment metagenome TaxID=412755 RepID=A0A0F9L4Q4_9ZZZZ
MLFAISGSQGSGKTTVINALKKEGFPVVERKTSRSIMDEWGVTLSEINNDRPLTIKFQDEIIERKFNDEKKTRSPGEIWFTERTYADFFTYALIAIGKDNEYSDWLNRYYEKCKEYQRTFTHNFYLDGGLLDLEHDGVRGSNKHYARMVDIVMKDVTKQMSAGLDPKTLGKIKPDTNTIKSKDINYRVKSILTTISVFL